MKPEATKDKCEAILQKMLEMANSDKPVTLSEDWGGNSATIVAGGGHTHVGLPDGTWDDFVGQLYNALHCGPGVEVLAQPAAETMIEPDPRMVELSRDAYKAGEFLTTEQYLEELRGMD